MSKKHKKKEDKASKKENKYIIFLKRLKYTIFDDESIVGWIAAFIFMFLLLKFIVMPISGFVLNTNYPVVAVISGSMEHKLNSDGFVCGKRPNDYKTNFDNWWNTCGYYYEDNYNITKDNFSSFPKKNGFNTGDVMFLYGTKPEKLELGDVIVFEGGRDKPIIHRIIKIEEINNEYYFTTKGDHNDQVYDFEKKIPEDKVLGRATLKIPFIGYVKIILFRLIESIFGLF